MKLYQKDIKKLSEFQGIINQSNKQLSCITCSIANFTNKSVKRHFTSIKKKGASSIQLLKTIMLLPFAGLKNISNMLTREITLDYEYSKNTYYRFKENEWINWRKILYSFFKTYTEQIATQIKSGLISITTKKKEPVVLVADDTILSKCGKTIEHISYVFDHAINRSGLGFKLLTLGIYDIKSFLPLDFSLHNEKGTNKKKPFGFKKKELKKRFIKERDEKSPGAKRESEVGIKKTIMLIEMIKRAVKKGVKADYLVVDKWFFSEKLLKTLQSFKRKIKFVGACKNNSHNFEFIYNGKIIKGIKSSRLKELCKNNAKRCKTLGIKYFSCRVKYKRIDLIIFFNKSNRSKNWEMLVTTDTNLSFIDAMKIYTKRWSIEVFFKDCKQNLNLGKSQSNYLDSQIADITIAFLQYTILLLKKRVSHYETLGGLLQVSKDLFIMKTIAENLWDIFIQILLIVIKAFDLDLLEAFRKFFMNPEIKELFLSMIFYKEKVNEHNYNDGYGNISQNDLGA